MNDEVDDEVDERPINVSTYFDGITGQSAETDFISESRFISLD